MGSPRAMQGDLPVGRPTGDAHTMNYIGSKYSLLGEITSVLEGGGVPRNGVALDLCAGTGAVAQLLKLRGHIVYANDWQVYAYLTSVAFVARNAFPRFGALLRDREWRARILDGCAGFRTSTYSIAGRGELGAGLPCAQVLAHLDRMPGTPGPFYEAYCCGGTARRMYYSRDNGLRIQAIRDRIEDWSRSGLIGAKDRAWLIACLIEAADRVANTASVYGAYLKHIKPAARRSLKLVALQPIPSHHPPARHRVYCEEGARLLRRLHKTPLQLIYVDPPYNQRQYGANYHILETLARWDLGAFEPRGVTGLRPPRERHSDFCMASTVEQAFRGLFDQARSEYLLCSYNNEGLLPEHKLLRLFDEFCTQVSFTQIHFRRYRAGETGPERVYKADRTREMLILGKLRRSTGAG